MRAAALVSIALVLLVAAPGAAELHPEMLVPVPRMLLPARLYDAPIDPAPLCLPDVSRERLAKRALNLVAAPVDPDAARHWIALYDRSGGRDVIARLVGARAAQTPMEIHAAVRALDQLRGE